MTTQLVHGGVRVQGCRVAEPQGFPIGCPPHPALCPRASLALPWVPGGSWKSPFPCLGLSFLMSVGGLQLLVSEVPRHCGWGPRDMSMSRKEGQSSGHGYLSQD